MFSFKITKQLLVEATGRQLAAVILLAPLCLVWPLPVRAADITPLPVPDGDTRLETVFGTVPATSTALQSAITGGGDVAGALTTYNNAVSAAAHNISLSGNVVPGPSTSVILSSVLSGTNIVIFAPSGTSATFGRVINSGSFFLGPGTVSSMIGNPGPSSAFTFSGLSNAQFGGAILNSGTATITNSSFERNFAGLAINGAGGAIQNSSGTATITNSTFMGNFSPRGGAISSGATLTITNSSFTNNSALSGAGGSDGGGAIYINGGTATITNSSFTNNSAVSGGGAIIVFTAGGSRSILTITNSSFSGNTAGEFGGAIYNISSGTATITNSSFTNNSAVSGGGAIRNNGIMNLDVGPGRTSTFSGNTAAGIASSISSERGAPVLNVHVAGGGLLDMRDPMSGSPLTVTESGLGSGPAGVWALGGTNSLASTAFSVDRGTL